MKKETTKELRELIKWAKNERAEWAQFLWRLEKRLKTMGKKTGEKTKF